MRAGERRSNLDATLRAAYGEGLLSEGTFVERVAQLLATGPVHPERLVGDLTLRRHRPLRLAVAERLERLTRLVRGTGAGDGKQAPLLALDWSGATEALLIGRSDSCDVRLENTTVSRRHARLLFRDGAWIVQDLGSKNGTLLNGQLVGRARLRPGDRIAFAEQAFRVD